MHRPTIRERHRNAFPISISRLWGEATWTAPDLWYARYPALRTVRDSNIALAEVDRRLRARGIAA